MKYEIFEHPQGSEEWKKERFKRVTASQTPILLFLNPSGYQKPDSLLYEKLTGKEEAIDSFKEVLFERGHEAEAAAREWVEGRFGIKFPSMTLISTQEPDLMASLDGFNTDQNIIFEAKWMGPKKIAGIKESGEIPKHHLCQIQAQLYVSDAKKCIYFGTDAVSESVMIEVEPDLGYQEQILTSVREFMSYLKTFQNRWTRRRDKK